MATNKQLANIIAQYRSLKTDYAACVDHAERAHWAATVERSFDNNFDVLNCPNKTAKQQQLKQRISELFQQLNALVTKINGEVA